ncbi:MAG: hypothetical protein U5L72_03150 [Bacteroidales bacterium]|nr:hypothetical protein [Bacteroidales bacterium]
MRTAQYEKDDLALPVPGHGPSVSKDNGKTWSMSVEEPALYNTAAKGFYGKDSKEDIFMFDN